MSFKISASSKYANPHPTPKSNKKDTLLTEEDYMLFGLEGQTTSTSSSRRGVPKAARQGGHCIRDSHAQSDHY